MDDIIKIFESLEESGLLIKVAGKTIKIEAKEKRVCVLACYYVHQVLVY